MKKMILIICNIVIVCLFSVLLSGCSFSRTELECIELNWGIYLPSEVEEVYSESEETFSGDGTRYTVVFLQEESLYYVDDFYTSKNSFFEEAVDYWTGKMEFEVPEEYLYDWEVEYSWKYFGRDSYSEEVTEGLETDEVFYLNYFKDMYMIFYPETSRMIIVQHFI